MKPYYQDDYVTLYHGDCLELADKWTGADVLVTDPPYGIDANFRIGGYGYVDTQPRGRRIAGDKDTSARDTAVALWGSKPRIVFGSWRAPRPDPVDHRLIWWKRGQGSGPITSAFMSQDEEVYVTGGGFVKSSPPKRSVFPTDEARHHVVQKVGHPTSKPELLMEWLLERCQPEWVVADPFSGSGSTLVAAKNMGRRAVGIELEERYCEIIAKRLSQEVFDFGAIK